MPHDLQHQHFGTATKANSGISSAIPGQDTVEIQGNNKHQPAPTSRTFQPNPAHSLPPAQQDNSVGDGEQASAAADTLGGAMFIRAWDTSGCGTD
ncbi:hypothetical protein AC579_4000 [Pseudocercospora musae]|uniref:Uncharacterized protein n=1 Tax=Pseudocercospora musae TaxID=113226 RepID=A0A139II10_9PEZI|nr:hypothetical protein AC579_4000 [Pseudocercospora musae]